MTIAGGGGRSFDEIGGWLEDEAEGGDVGEGRISSLFAPKNPFFLMDSESGGVGIGPGKGGTGADTTFRSGVDAFRLLLEDLEKAAEKLLERGLVDLVSEEGPAEAGVEAGTDAGVDAEDELPTRDKAEAKNPCFGVVTVVPVSVLEVGVSLRVVF